MFDNSLCRRQIRYFDSKKKKLFFGFSVSEGGGKKFVCLLSNHDCHGSTNLFTTSSMVTCFVGSLRPPFFFTCENRNWAPNTVNVYFFRSINNVSFL